jgi:hypothetical protein
LGIKRPSIISSYLSWVGYANDQFGYYDTYEEALETGLQQALKLVVKRLRMKVVL